MSRRQPTGQSLVHEHVKLKTADPTYAWVNPLEIWGIGLVDLAAGTIDVIAYLHVGPESFAWFDNNHQGD